MALVGITAIGVLSAASTTILVNTLLQTLSNTHYQISKFFNMDKPTYNHIMKKLEKFDIEFMIKIISMSVRELDTKIKNSNEIVIYNGDPDAKRTAIGYIISSLDMINNELVKIYDDAKYHNLKYFKNWRTFDCNVSTNKIKTQLDILKQRYNMFIQLIQIDKIYDSKQLNTW